VLAVTSHKRLSGKLSSIPTFKELGADVEFGNWRGIVGPRGMSLDQISYWDAVMKKLIATPEWQLEIKNQLSESQYMSPSTSKKFLDEENQKLTKLLIDLGFAKK
jgi:putative tricarboxylic transport membrane protein